MSEYNMSWDELAFSSKKHVNELKAVFIAAPREISPKRFVELIKQNLGKSNIIIGVAYEKYIDGFDGQAQFRTLKLSDVKKAIVPINGHLEKVNSPYKVYTLNYNQKEQPYIFDKLKFKKVIMINGSWLHAFHTRSEYIRLMKRKIDYELVSPFVDEAEARAFEAKHDSNNIDSLLTVYRNVSNPASQMLDVASLAATKSYDYMFQTGVSLGIKEDSGDYKLLATAYNKIVPYQTYAMHHGASRETNFSPPNDLNHYDTVHAEVELIITAQKEQIDLKGTTLFINLMPCPHCSRMIADTDIAEVVYQFDHSEGYAVKMLEAAGKIVTRIVT